jgi:hypothetical protein
MQTLQKSKAESLKNYYMNSSNALRIFSYLFSYLLLNFSLSFLMAGKVNSDGADICKMNNLLLKDMLC